MNSKIKQCQNCKSKFTIEPEDFEFYKKIDVPEPTFCPECRLIRRTAFRNIRRMYKNKCDFSGKEVISVFQPKSPYKIYERKIWWSDKWDPMDYGRDYDFSKSFFKQFDGLMKEIPWANLKIVNSVDCDYCSGLLQGKNCYMVHGGYIVENCLYVDGPAMTKDSMDSNTIVKCERVYECFDSNNSYNLLFSTYCDECIDSAFLYNCRNCQNCFGCVNLKHKKYHIFNQPYTKAEYFKEIKKYDLGSYQVLLKIKKKFRQFNLGFPKPWARIIKSVDVTGDYVNNAKNCQRCFSIYEGAEDCKFLYMSGLVLKDSYDVNGGGAKSELLYESDFITSGRNIIGSSNLDNCYNVSYSVDCDTSNDLFGCIGLRHKKYCIFNKQYSKESFDKLRTKIKKHMDEMPYTDKKGRVYGYGEFFPIELSRFGYNETPVMYHFPLTRKQALIQGYPWYDKFQIEYKPTIKANNLPNHIKEVDNSIFQEVIECQNKLKNNCDGSGVFKIIPAELKFYKKHNLSLPRICSYCRNRERSNSKNPAKLYHRKCQCAGRQSDNKTYQNVVEHIHHKDKHCSNRFQTTYAPDRKEIIYCKECYNKERS